MSDFTAALERELGRLEGELEQDPRTRRIKQIRQLLADYRTTNGPVALSAASISPTGAPSRPHVAASPSSSRRRHRVRLSKAASVRMAVRQLLTKEGTVHRREILKNLVEQQLMGHEKNPMVSLAAYLSDWKDDFASDGHGNFKLKKSAESADAASVSH